MHELKKDTGPEKVILAGLYLNGSPKDLFEEDMAEMATLCDTAGALVTDTLIQKMAKPVASTYLGPGKIKEIKERMIETGATTVIIDAELKPSQIKNIEKIVEAKVIDRSQLILDIFSLHAKTNEARIQVELAQLEILYPRLTQMWAHLSRQDGGGVGTRGPGETQLETDRRLVQKKIAFLKDKLEKIVKVRENQRKSREDQFRCSIVGYTNVGKSTLLNAMSGSDVLAENKLFATLDTSSRKTFIPGSGEVVMTDTVGFLRKLPHHLVASFRSTLEVVNEADLLIVVMDSSTRWYNAQMNTVKEVLASLGAEDKPIMVVFNKDDLIVDEIDRKAIELDFPNPNFVSALDPESVSRLKQAIGETIVEVKRERERQKMIKVETRPVIEVG